MASASPSALSATYGQAGSLAHQGFQRVVQTLGQPPAKTGVFDVFLRVSRASRRRFFARGEHVRRPRCGEPRNRARSAPWATRCRPWPPAMGWARTQKNRAWPGLRGGWWWPSALPGRQRRQRGQALRSVPQVLHGVPVAGRSRDRKNPPVRRERFGVLAPALLKNPALSYEVAYLVVDRFVAAENNACHESPQFVGWWDARPAGRTAPTNRAECRHVSGESRGAAGTSDGRRLGRQGSDGALNAPRCGYSIPAASFASASGQSAW